MATYLDVVNKVLLRLRESSVTSVSNTEYSKLIGAFVNDIKREVEDVWTWTNLRSSVTVTTSDGTSTYSLTGSGDRAKILRDKIGRYDVWNDTSQFFLQKADSYRAMDSWLDMTTVQKGSPQYFMVDGLDSNGDLKVTLFPVPDGVYSLKFHMYIPQSDLVNDTDVIKVPAHVVELGAWSQAIYERGEDSGYLSDLAAVQYKKALGNAIIIDQGLSSEHIEWYVG